MTQSNSHTDKPVLGLMLRLLAIAILASMFAIVKYLGEQNVHVVEILFYRFLFGAIMTGAWVVSRTGIASLKTDRLRLHILRAVIGIIAMGANFWAVMILPMAEAATIGFTVPLISTVLSVILLAEYVGLRRWMAVIIGFVGIIIAIQPWHSAIPLIGASIAFTGAIAGAFTMIMMRQLSATEDSTKIVFYYTIIAVPITGIAMFWFAQWHTPQVFCVLVFVSVLGTVGQWALSESLRYANIAVVMPMDYSNLIFATAYGYLFWDQWPQHSLWLGIPFIIGSGIYIALRERKLAAQRAKHPEEAPVLTSPTPEKT